MAGPAANRSGGAGTRMGLSGGMHSTTPAPARLSVRMYDETQAGRPLHAGSRCFIRGMPTQAWMDCATVAQGD